MGILVADVSGHGVPAALIASMVKIVFAAQADNASDPARVITGMNHALCGKFSWPTSPPHIPSSIQSVVCWSMQAPDIRRSCCFARAVKSNHFTRAVSCSPYPVRRLLERFGRAEPRRPFVALHGWPDRGGGCSWSVLRRRTPGQKPARSSNA